MISIILACSEPGSFTKMIQAFEKRGIPVDIAPSGAAALEKLNLEPDAVLVTDEALPDMSGLALVEKTVTSNPMVNCVAISSLPAKAFHDASEGLGVLMPFPEHPDEQDVQKLLDHLEKIHSL